MLNNLFKVLLLIILISFFAGCAENKMNAIATVKPVDIPRFMGDWYVIAAIPTVIETQAYNAIENCQLDSDGTIATTFTYYKAAFDGPLKTYHPRGFVNKESGNGLWGMQFIWPFKADFRIAYLDDNYQRTIIARNARDYVWIMARTPQISEENYREMTDFVKNLGYDMSKLRKVPQDWSKKPNDVNTSNVSK